MSEVYYKGYKKPFFIMSVLNTTKQRFFKFAEIIHLRIFGHEMGEEMRKFLGNLSWSFFGGVIAAGILFAVNILAGRLLGPEEYGRYGFIVAFSSAALLLMTIGLDITTLHFVAKNKNHGERVTYLSTSFFSVLALTMIGVILLLKYSNYLVWKFSINKEMFGLAIILTVVLTFKNLLDSYLRGLELFKEQGKYKIFEAVLITCSFFIFLASGLFFERINYVVYISSILTGSISVILLVGFRVKSYLRVRNFSFKILRGMMNYGSFVLLGGISSILLLNFDKILVSKYLGDEQLGVYSAYYASSMTITTYLTVIFLNVFFPKVSRETVNKELVLKKINKLSLMLVVPSVIFIFFITRVALFLFGEAYEMDLLLIFEFSILSFLFAYFTVIWWLIAATGVRGMSFTSIFGLLIGIIFVLMMVSFKTILSIQMVTAFLILSVVTGIISGNYVLLKKIIT